MSITNIGHSEARGCPPHTWCDRPDSAPAAIVLPILGMLGGLCGEPVSVWLQGFPPDVLGALQRFIREHARDELVCEIFGPSDIRRLLREVHDLAIVLVHPTSGHASSNLVTQWLLGGRRGRRLPMALLCGDPCDHEVPGAALSLRAGPAETARLRSFFAGQPLPDERVREFLPRPGVARIDPSFAGLPSLFGSPPESLWTPRSLHAVLTLRGLLTGHSLLRRLSNGSADQGLVSPDLVDYAGVYEILQKSRAGLPEESGDPVLAAMIRRANLYLKDRGGVTVSPGAVDRGRGGLTSIATPRNESRETFRRAPISLRELADLGNVRSAMTRALISTALGTRDVEVIQGLGLCKKVPGETDPASLREDEIARLLVAWTMKQVRKRFDRLRREGFVDAERIPPGNGAWVLHLPEALKPLPGEFQDLPTVERVAEAVRLKGGGSSPA